MNAQNETRERAAAIWLAAGAAGLIIALVFHGPPDPDLSVQMDIIADGHTRWSGVHWIAAVAMSLFAAAGMTMMSSPEDETKGFAVRTAWAAFTLGALWTMTTAVAEATAVTRAATAGNQAIFEAWWGFSSGKANGFMALALAVIVIAMTDSRSETPATRRWAATGAAFFAAASAFGWIINSWFFVAIGGPIWLISSLLMNIWLCWFGIATGRRGAPR